MRKQVLFLLAVMLNCVMFGQLTWTNGSGDNQYNNENNWDEGYVPDEATDVRMDGRVSLDDLIVSGESIGDVTTSGIAKVDAGRMIIKPTGRLIFAGSRWSAIGWDAECTLIVEAGGYIEFGEHLWLGFNSGANSHMYVYGTVRVNAMYGQNFEGKGTDGSSSSDVIIHDGGHLDLGQWADDGRSLQGANHTLSIMGGALMTVPGDYTTQLETDVAEGNLLAPGGTIEIVFVAGATEEDPGLTTVTSSAEPLSLKDYATLDFSVYPNPSSDNISIQSKTEISNVQLFNSLGQNVLEVKGKSNIDISKLSAGLYVLKAQDAEGNLGVKRVIKQ